MKTIRFAALIAAAATLLTFAARADAHFLWAEIAPAKIETKTDAKTETKVDAKTAQVRLRFAEGADEATNGVPLERLKQARAWNTLGKNLALQTDGDALSSSLASSDNVAGAHQTWGVLDKTAEGRGVFLLEYSAKAARNLDAALQSAKLPLELFAGRDLKNAKEIVATLKRGDNVVSGAAVKLHLPSSETRDLITDANGQVRFATAGNGVYGLRALQNLNQKGKHANIEYSIVRHYTTLTFPIGQISSLAKTVALTTTKSEISAGSDRDAYLLLKNANANRQVVPADFIGFTADVLYIEDGEAHNGTLTYLKKGETKISFPDLDEKDSDEWVRDQISNITGHRRGGDFAKGDGKNAITFAAGDGVVAENKFGRLVNIADGFKSNYRIKDNKVTEVTRTAGGSRFTISVIETFMTDENKYLSNHFAVSYRDEKSGALQRVEGFRDAYAKVGDAWLPAMRTVMAFTPDDATPTIRTIKFRNIQVLKTESTK